jgi:KDO2-lipid IV(A) lauroyltransferase
MLAATLKLLSRLPLSALYGFSPLIEFVLYRVVPSRRAIVLGNLNKAFPELEAHAAERLAHQIYRNYADVAMEMIKSLTITASDLDRRITISGGDTIDHYLRQDQPVLVTVAHQCNIHWLLLAMNSKFDHPLEAVYRPLSNRSLDTLMSKIYRRFGGRLIPDRSVVSEVMQRRGEPRLVSIAPDQAPNWQDETYWTTFLNQETGFFQAPEILAKFANYPVVFVGMSRIKRGYYQADIQLLAAPPYRKDDHAITEGYVHAVEAQIKSHPADWFWFHNRWKRKRPLYG